jgi:hypothetical protein
MSIPPHMQRVNQSHEQFECEIVHTHYMVYFFLSQLHKFLNTCTFLLKMLHNILFVHKPSTLHYTM